MSQELFQLEDGTVFINKISAYQDSFENFKKDYSETTEFQSSFEIYNRTLKVRVSNNELLPFEANETFDKIIDSIDSIITAQKTRIGTTAGS